VKVLKSPPMTSGEFLRPRSTIGDWWFIDADGGSAPEPPIVSNACPIQPRLV
jgi:hypothetical protein